MACRASGLRASGLGFWVQFMNFGDPIAEVEGLGFRAFQNLQRLLLLQIFRGLSILESRNSHGAGTYGFDCRHDVDFACD